ncbi:MAG: hypothetical protein JSS91_07150 [Bacteroidetes bacterium]|nr:hypothetical protein [Bacteroidota bacterium]
MGGCKILIIGNGGTGKSTLADRLGRELNIPVTHLDMLSWRDNFERVPEEEFVNELNKIFAKEKMIIEGWAYHSTMYNRLKWADKIIYLKYPLDRCLDSVFTRNKEYNNRAYPFDPFTGDRESMHDLYRKAVERVHKEYEPEVQSWLSSSAFKDKEIFVISSIDELNKRYSDIFLNIKADINSHKTQ